MRNKFLISCMLHFLMGILFVFPIYLENDFECSNVSSYSRYFGNENVDNEGIDKNRTRNLSTLRNYGIVSYLPAWNRESDSCSDFLLKYSQQIADISLKKCIKSVVIRC